jgi:hypothetical protein
VTRPAIQQAVSDFFSAIGRLDAPMGELMQRAFLTHLAGLTEADLPVSSRALWRQTLQDHLGVEPGDRAAIEAAAEEMPAWPDDRLDDFVNALGAFVTLAAPPPGMAGRLP